MPPIVRVLASNLKRLALSNGLILSRTTEPAKLKRFLEALKPTKTNINLTRIGGDGDGGYLVPDDLDGIQACFSPGVSDIATFEQDLAGRGIRSFLADYSVDHPPIQHELMEFEKKFLGPVDRDEFMTLENWVRRKASSEGDLILQMDIEGAEYGVIFDTSRATLRKFRILVIEFHGLDALCDKGGFELINLTFAKLLTDFEVVHIHPNNCFPATRCNGLQIPPLMEFSFLRKDRISTRESRTDFPHEFDRPSLMDRDDYALPDCWFR